MNFDRDAFWMQHAISLAEYAASSGEVPVGAVLVRDDKIIGEGWNRPIAQQDPTAHAEIIALRNAAQSVENYRLLDATLYVTLEPCIMCVGAIIHARINRLVHGAFDLRAGAVVSQLSLFDHSFLNHRVQYTSAVMADQCGALLTKFFQQRRVS